MIELRTVRALSLALSLVVATTSVSCGPTLGTPERRECRRLRARTFGRAVGMTVGVGVVFGVVLLVAAGGGSSPNFGGGGSGRRARRRDHRQRRVAVCREGASAEGGGEYDVPDHDPNAPEISDAPASVGPPTAQELTDAVVAQEAALRSCAADAAAAMPGSTLYIDARIDGATGRVAGVSLVGEPAPRIDARCVYHALQPAEFRRFDAVVDVRWALIL